MPKAARARCRPVPFTSVAIEGEFWGPRLDTNRNVTLPIEYAVAIDYNGNGRRDYSEPVVDNSTDPGRGIARAPCVVLLRR